MSNTIGWGKGASNNSIGWGNVGTNGFGSIYSSSNSGETDLAAAEANVFQDAAVAYSLRDLGLGATSVVRVRRSLDNVEQDFTASEITDGTLTTFCGVGNGFVSVLYNQKGGNNANQTSASAQPRIVNTGSLILQNGKPSMSFDGLDSLEINITKNTSVFSVLSSNQSVTINYLTFNTISPQGLYIGGLTFNIGVFDGNLNDTTFDLINQGLVNYDFTGSGYNVSLNDSNDEFLSDVNLIETNFIGRPSGGFSISGLFQEIIIFNNSQANKKESIKTNINDYYAIY